MTLTAREQDQLRQSFERLQSEFDQFSTDFYERLFRRAPALRAMFREDLAGQGMKFMTTLREVIFHAQDTEGEGDRLEELGRGHASLGVTADHFAPMEEALIETLRDTLGDECSDDLEAVWRKAYEEMSAAMIRKGGIG